MAESAAHMEYVRNIVNYMEIKFQCSTNGILLTDLPETAERPDPVINGFIPDVLYMSKDYYIIGEAKTVNDVDNWHTKEQVRSYIEQLKTSHREKHLFLCTTWTSSRTFKNLIIRLRKEISTTDIIVHLMDENGISII